MYDYIIVGSGLFGATCAYKLSKAGKKCLVVERRAHIGGNVYTESVRGITVHKYGAHIFHTDDKEIWDFVNSLAPFNNFVNSPLAVYGNEVYNLPFNMNTFSKLFDIKTPGQAKAVIEKERFKNFTPEPKTLEEQAINLVGKTVYEKLIKGYTEKQWGRPCSELPAFLIKRLPVRFTYDNNYFNDRFQGVPCGGYTALIEKMLETSEVKLNCDFVTEKSKLVAQAKKIIFTGAIDEYFGYRFGALSYRTLKFESQVLNEENYQGNAVVNYTSAEVAYTRIIEHKHFEKNNESPHTIITREYPSEWKIGREPFYPVNDAENSALYAKYKTLSQDEKDVIFGGRLGTYKYLDMDDVISSAFKLCAEELKK